MIIAELVKSSSANWELFGKEIFYVEKTVFVEKSFDERMMKDDMDNLETILVLLKDKGRIIGFTYAIPESDGVARIVDVAILKEYQHNGHISSLMTILEKEMVRKGYKYFTEDAMIENGYADKITRHYSQKIVESWELVSEYGKQCHFKIRI